MSFDTSYVMSRYHSYYVTLLPCNQFHWGHSSYAGGGGGVAPWPPLRTATAGMFSCWWGGGSHRMWACIFCHCIPQALRCAGGMWCGGSPTAVRPSDPALFGSRPLVTPYYCRLGDLLCLFCVYRFVSTLLSVYICI